MYDEDVIFLLGEIKDFEDKSNTSEFITTTQNIALSYINMTKNLDGGRHEKNIQKEMKFLLNKCVEVVKKRKKIEAVFRAYLVDVLCRKVGRWFKSAEVSQKFAVFATKLLISGGITAALFLTLPKISVIAPWIQFLLLGLAVGVIVFIGVHIGSCLIGT